MRRGLFALRLRLWASACLVLARRGVCGGRLLYDSPPHAAVLSAVGVFLAADLQFLLPWLHNAKEQLCPTAELVVAVVDPDTGAKVQAAAEGLHGCAVRLVLFDSDPGLFGAWDELVVSYARTPLVTLTAPYLLRQHMRLREVKALFEADPALDGVAFPASALDDAGTEHTQWLAPAGVRRLSASMLLQTSGGGEVVGAENLLLAGPVWTKDLHARFGPFARAPYGACNGWAFFLTALLEGAVVGHAGGLPATRSMRRLFRGPAWTPPPDCVQQAVSSLGLRQLGLYNNVRFGAGSVVAKRVVVLAEALPFLAEGGHVRLMQLLQFLSLNGHRVTLVAREAPWKDSPMRHTLRTLRVDTVLDLNPLHLDKTLTHACHNDTDLVIMHGAPSAKAGSGMRLARWRRVTSLCPSPRTARSHSELTRAPPRRAAWFWRDWLPDAGSRPSLGSLWGREGGCLRKPLLVVTDDVHHVRCQQTVTLRPERVCAETRAAEAALYGKAAMVFAISSQDADVFRTLSPAPVSVLPFTIAQTGLRNGYGARHRVTYIGSAHSANVLALDWFLAHVWPAINLEPQARLTLIGSDRWHAKAAEHKVKADVIPHVDGAPMLPRTSLRSRAWPQTCAR